MHTAKSNDIEKLESDSWRAADNLCANTKLALDTSCMPIVSMLIMRSVRDFVRPCLMIESSTV